MLRTRILTALVLLAVLLPVLFLGPVWLGALVALLVVALACWEWMRLLGYAHRSAVLIAAAFALCVVLFVWPWPAVAVVLAVVAGVFWIFGAPVLLARGLPVLAGPVRAGFAALGALVLAATWAGMVAALQRGPVYLLSVLVIVWVSDIAAYFFGRSFGRVKLAPSISPGKTWEGVAGALLTVLVAGVVYSFGRGAGWPADFFGMLAAHAPFALLPLVLVVLVALGIVGDLFESLLKRRAGRKDSSALLPGHGGVFDRIDALLPVLPVALLVDTVLTGMPFLTERSL